MPIRKVDQSSVMKIRKVENSRQGDINDEPISPLNYDTQIQGSIEKTQKPNTINALKDIFKLKPEEYETKYAKTKELPRIIESLTSGIVDPVKSTVSAITNPLIDPLIDPLFKSVGLPTSKEMPDTRFKPNGAIEETFRFAGELLPSLLMKGGKVGLDALSGAVTGSTQSADRGNELGEILKDAAIGAGINVAAGAGLKGAGAAFKKVQPLIAKGLSGIPIESYKKGLEKVKAGEILKPVDEKKFIELSNRINKVITENKDISGKDVGAEILGLTANERIPIEKVKELIENEISKSYRGADISARYEGAKPVINKIENLLKLRQGKSYKVGDEILTQSEMEAANLPIDMFPAATDEAATTSLSNLHQAKEMLQSEIPYNKAEWRPRDYLLNDLEKEIRGLIESKSPEYAKSNKLFKDLIEAQKGTGGITPSKLFQTGTRQGELKQYGTALQELENALYEIELNNIVKQMGGNIDQVPFKKFMPELEELGLQQDLSGGLSKWMSLMAANKGLSTGAGLVGAGGTVGATALNPLIGASSLGLLLEQSPAFQRELLNLYGRGQKITPYAGRTGMVGFSQPQD